MGWKIFLHSVRMVLDNLDVALRISLGLYLVQVAMQVVVFNATSSLPADPVDMPEGGGMPFEALVLAVLALVTSLWIAVGWHRYALEGEEPAAFLPRWRGSELGSYVWKSIVIAFALGVVLAVVGGIAVSAAMAVPGLLGIVSFGLVGLISYLFFRVGLVLPAAAVGRPLTMRESWQATGDGDKAVLMLALIVIGAQVLISVPAMIDGNTSSVVSLIYSVVVNWFVTMIGVSILTTLYGHFIEGRPID
ncbi:hypothetical protein GCM10011415_30080 [Salipiger pallidus]|uniref:Uncharacterized protein n=1 Tax=Salipiger pallidus TaxID=1775170 RepID=A0A8J2ZLX4_9RHOB|nr:hypothetical protein [Salipiger pallidus]GGG78998.1 hypothetical protein GCM10011415_30080 [Salipiger pallidus]